MENTPNPMNTPASTPSSPASVPTQPPMPSTSIPTMTPVSNPSTTVASAPNPKRGALLTMILAGLVVIAGGVWLLQGYKTNTGKSGEYQQTEEVNVENALTTTAKIPEGFPSDIPVDKNALVESYAANYDGRNTTQYTVRYHTAENFDKKWDEYVGYMKQAGYQVKEEKQYGSIAGMKENSNLFVSLIKQVSGADVAISYIVRQ